MCDWEAAEYEEYLLWVDAEHARAFVRTQPPTVLAPVKSVFSVVHAVEAVEA